jgi:type IV pilus assembly protein PilO
MTKLEKVRTIFIFLLAVFLAADAGLVAYLVWPGASNQIARQAQEQELRQELIRKTQQVSPLKGIDKKLVETRADIKKFYAERVLGHWSQISNEVHKLAQENGVTLQDIRYKAEAAGLPGLQRVNIETGVAGDYLKLARFINSLERDKSLFLINQVSFVGEPTGTVQLQMKFETFLKEAA